MKYFITILGFALAATIATQCERPMQAAVKKKPGLPVSQKIQKSDAEWAKLLTPEQFNILRQQGTERPFTGKYHDHHEKGVYVCAACKLPLFSWQTKFESGTGWPSFFQPVKTENVEEISDNSYGMTRVEVRCGRCGGHLGHVFDDGPGARGSAADTKSSSRMTDGPNPTGLRYCINSASLAFEAQRK